MASGWTYYLLHKLINDFLSGATLKVLLVDDNDAFDKTTVDFVNDISANELTGGNYTRKTLASKAVTKGTNGHAAWVDFADVIWTALTGHTIDKAYIYKEVTNDADSPVLWVLDGTNIVTNGGDVTLVFDSSDGAGYLNG